ncbi:zf-4CXXC_R1 domain-containing protein [Chloropicon roscoffensis]|uniref:Zf-4CXXC_R1 domain-containing protein n=2 Tax=Chloropicon roscoffensis TaxID=1461544 RepID=A0AAX4PEH1_9CHLO
MPPQERETLEPRPARQLRLSEVYAKEKKKFSKRKNKGNTIQTTNKQAKPIQVAVDENDDECGMCGVGGDLVCCEGCPKAFHPKCVDLDPKNLPEGDWYCRECVAKTGKVEPAESQEEETETEEDAAVVDEEVVVEARSARTEATPSSYELERQRRIQANREKMSALVLGAKTAIMKKANEHKDRMAVARRAKYLKRLQRGAEKPRQQKVKSSARPNTRQKTKMIRTSRRLRGEQAPETEEDQFKFEQLSYEYDETERDSRMILSSDVRGKDTKEEKAKIKKLMERRCDNRGRGSVYDSKVGITCHFCRQKKLCAEEDCPRCSTRSVTKECIGKSDCSRCHSATGMFCRACLLIRYGLELEDVREKMAKGEWLCPHCYEEDHPNEGWICNSSICMTRRGMAPTGIAIYEAQGKGFQSVAHFVQAKLLKTLKTMRAK